MDYNFEWDPKKARSNLEKHGIAFVEAFTEDQHSAPIDLPSFRRP